MPGGWATVGRLGFWGEGAKLGFCGEEVEGWGIRSGTLAQAGPRAGEAQQEKGKAGMLFFLSVLGQRIGSAGATIYAQVPASGALGRGCILVCFECPHAGPAGWAQQPLQDGKMPRGAWVEVGGPHSVILSALHTPLLSGCVGRGGGCP